MIFESSVDKTSEIVTIICPKRIDVNVSDELRDLITKIIDGGKFRIILDLKSTEYIDSSGLGAIVARISVLRSHEGDIRFAVPGTSVLNLLELTHLNKILRTFDNLEQATASFTSD
jgi:anti-sigma B factor antagonist